MPSADEFYIEEVYIEDSTGTVWVGRLVCSRRRRPAVRRMYFGGGAEDMVVVAMGDPGLVNDRWRWLRKGYSKK